MMTDKQFSEKLKIVENVSNIFEVIKKAQQIYGKDVKIGLSTRKNNKFMIYDDKNDKWHHFGDINYEDFTKHKDKKRRERFQIRNHKWSSEPKYSLGYMSYYILW